jgi:hypothetical protein
VNKVPEKGVNMDLGVIEWSFNCDEASKNANDLFSKVMNRGWLLQKGIHPFDIDAAWAEVEKQLSQLGEPCVLTVTRATKPSALWDLFIANLTRGDE